MLFSGWPAGGSGFPHPNWLGTLAGFEAIQFLPLFVITSAVTNTRGSQLTKTIGLLGHGFIGSSPQSVGPVTLRPVVVYNMSGRHL